MGLLSPLDCEPEGEKDKFKSKRMESEFMGRSISLALRCKLTQTLNPGPLGFLVSLSPSSLYSFGTKPSPWGCVCVCVHMHLRAHGLCGDRQLDPERTLESL